MNSDTSKSRDERFEKESSGNVTVKIYSRQRPTAKGETRTIWEVANYVNGRRRLTSFSDAASAHKEAKRIAELLSSGQAVAAGLRASEAAEYGNAIAILRNANIETSLQTVADRYARMVEIYGSEDVIKAVEVAKEHKPDNITPASLQQIADELVALKENRQASDRYVGDLRARLNTIAKQFPVTADMVTTKDLQTWFDGMDAAPRTVRNFRQTASALFKFAEARGYIAKGKNPVTGTEGIKAKNGNPIQIYSPDEMEKLLQSASADIRIIIALQAFAGIRSQEILRLEWGDIKRARGHIELAADKAKTASRRIVPILPNLAAWLKGTKKKKGLIFTPNNLTAFDRRMNAEAFEPAGVTRKENALRHSFISYRVADTQNVAQVALEAGNSPAMIFSHYRELVTPDDAKKWFAIQPKAAQ
ncbi:MAG: site-specific integrase [Formivibrio sp.]|nr:site-specific integrase [Formivibrio sp.]